MHGIVIITGMTELLQSNPDGPAGLGNNDISYPFLHIRTKHLKYNRIQQIFVILQWIRNGLSIGSFKVFLKKLIFGKPSLNKRPPHSAIENRISNIKAIWNNDHDDDVGIEKILRLFLASSQFLFPGLYIKEFFWKKGATTQDIAVDVFILIKVAFPLIMLINGWQNNVILLTILIWFLLETLLYVPSLIFASDIVPKPRSYRRSMLLLFFNYMEIIFDFAVIYASGHYLNMPLQHWYDAVYFSLVTMASIGYGDYFPVTAMGKLLSGMQSIIFLIFVVLFLNFFSSRVEKKGYFDHSEK